MNFKVRGESGRKRREGVFRGRGEGKGEGKSGRRAKGEGLRRWEEWYFNGGRENNEEKKIVKEAVFF